VEPAWAEDSALAVRPPRYLLAVPRPRGALLRTAPLRESLGTPCICWLRFFLVRSCGDPGKGVRAFSLIGLTAPGLGLRGDGCRMEVGTSTFFHRVDEAEVVIRVGFDGRCLPDVLDIGVC